MQIDLNELENNAAAAESLLKLMANANRLMILCQLSETASEVSGLVSKLGLSQSAVSQHLAKLRKAGVVSTKKQGTKVIYQVTNKTVVGLLETLQAAYCRDN